MTIRENLIEARQRCEEQSQKIDEAIASNASKLEIVDMKRHLKELDADATRWTKLVEEFQC